MICKITTKRKLILEMELRDERRYKKFNYSNTDKKIKMPSVNFLSWFLSSASFSRFASGAFLFVEKNTNKNRTPFGKLAKEPNPTGKTKTLAKKISFPSCASLIISCLLTVLFFGCSNENKDLKILFAGDIMLDRGVRNNIEKNGIDYIFDDIKTISKSSDYTIANFECVACEASLKPIDKKFTTDIIMSFPEFFSLVTG